LMHQVRRAAVGVALGHGGVVFVCIDPNAQTPSPAAAGRPGAGPKTKGLHTQWHAGPCQLLVD
jgi:hypothetical protein